MFENLSEKLQRSFKDLRGQGTLTDENINGHYNNFYEFGMSKNIADPAHVFAVSPAQAALKPGASAQQELNTTFAVGEEAGGVQGRSSREND